MNSFLLHLKSRSDGPKFRVGKVNTQFHDLFTDDKSNNNRNDTTRGSEGPTGDYSSERFQSVHVLVLLFKPLFKFVFMVKKRLFLYFYDDIFIGF